MIKHLHNVVVIRGFKQNFYAAKIRLARTLKKSEDGRIVIFGDELYR